MAMLARRAVVRAMAYKNSKIPFQFTCSSSPSSSSSSDVLLRNCWLPPLGLINYNRPPDDGHACSGWAKQQIREFGEIAGLQVAETRRLVQQVNMELLKKQLHASGHKEFVMYEDLINLCRQTGVATSEEAAERFVQALDEAGVVLIFRGKVFLHPEEEAILIDELAIRRGGIRTYSGKFNQDNGLGNYLKIFKNNEICVAHS